jgi:N-acyl-D-aspartate/D-glutamate deacylase
VSWQQHHRASEEAAFAAHQALRRADLRRAQRLFAAAAQAELAALAQLVPAEKPRTFGITAVSAAALLHKAGQPQAAEQFARKMLEQSALPDFAAAQLREVLQAAEQGRG